MNVREVELKTLGWMFLIFASFVLLAAPVLAQSVSFDDSSPTLIVLSNNSYEIGLRKTNGSLAYILDKATGQVVSAGSRYECLWGAYGSAGYVGGCSYSAAGANHFSYTWNAAPQTLTLNYSPDPAAAQQVTAQVTVTASTEAWFDLQLQLTSAWGSVLDYALFPSDLVFPEAQIEQVLLPALPGVVFEPSFFAQNRSYVASYPGGWFADYMALSSSTGQIAVYAINDTDSIAPVVLGFNHDEAYLADSTDYYHAFGVRLDDGQTWTSPRVRVRVSQPFLDTLEAYRVDNGLDHFRSLREKLGQRYNQVVQSPVLKADAVQLAVPFTQYETILAQLPSPGLFHPVAFQPRGFDENYPDFLPPASNWGTTAEMAAMFRQAQALGFLVMPYTNPTWWDEESPTLQNLTPSLTLTDVVVLDTPTTRRYETYGSHGGYVVSPYAPFVQQRLSQLNWAMTGDVPSDLLFEDQIGARSWLFDHNSASPSPRAYAQGWLEHTRRFSDTLLMTENGFDRLAETEVGFHGSLLLADYRSDTGGMWGSGTWHYYPLAPLLVRDKVLLYQHDLAEETTTINKKTFTWNLAFGYLLTYDLGYGGGLSNPWLEVVSAFQKYALARYAAEKMTQYEVLQAQVTRTSFETVNVIINWHETLSYPSGPYTLPPLGTVGQKNDGSLVFGVFTAYNHLPLSNGEHYLIEERGDNTISIRQALGADTPLTIALWSGWKPSDTIEVRAYTQSGQMITPIPAALASDTLTFTYQNQLAGQGVSYYELYKFPLTFLPVILK